MNKYLQRIRNHNAMGDLTRMLISVKIVSRPFVELILDLFLPWTTGPSKRAPIHLWKRSDLADEHPKLYTAEELLQLMTSADEDESF